MRKYKYLLFDIDGTLLDFYRCERAAYKDALHDHGIFEEEDRICDVYSPINQKWWKKLERKECTKQETLELRHKETFELLGMDIDYLKFEDSYMSHLATYHFPMEGAIELLLDLRKKGYTIIAVTNGVYTTQVKRMAEADITNKFDAIYISEKIGFEKPDVRFFEVVFKDYPEINSENTLLIGDSLTSDMKGGENAKLDTCWLNVLPYLKAKDVHPTYEIRELKEIYKILDNE